MTDFIAQENTAKTIKYVIELAELTGSSGITLTGSVVSTAECVAYQIKEHNLIMSFYRNKHTGTITTHLHNTKH